MDLLLLFFAIPLAVIILSIVLQKILKCPWLVAATFFAIFLIVTFAVGDIRLLIFTVVYTIISYITALIFRAVCNLMCNGITLRNINARNINTNTLNANQVIDNNRIASRAEYFSFGTNDLTQMTFGYSRDDIASFLPVYLEKKILKVDPFQVLDQNGVGQLVKMAVANGRKTRPALKCGICGEHGGDPSSIEFCHKAGLDYVSCSPFRVPIARLAAAQAAIASELQNDSEGDTNAAAKEGIDTDELKEKAKKAANEAAKVGREVAKEAVKVGKEAAKAGKEVAFAGVAGLKAGIAEAKKAYKENKNKDN